MTYELVYEPDPSGGLLVRARNRGRCADLLLAEHGACLLAFQCAPVALPWPECRSMGWFDDGPAPDAWLVTRYTVGRRGEFGISVGVSGRLDAEARAMYRATTTPWRRFDLAFNSFSGSTDRHFIPIVSAVFSMCENERATLQALCRVLVDRPELRAGLADPARLDRLAADLSATMLPFEPNHASSGVLPATVDIGIALERCGYTHKYTRPLAGDPLPSLDEMVERIQERLRHNPPGPGRDAEREDIERLARKAYLDVEPWPFAALFD